MGNVISSGYDQMQWKACRDESQAYGATTRGAERRATETSELADQPTIGMDALIDPLCLQKWEKQGFVYHDTWCGVSSLQDNSLAGTLYNPYGAPTGTKVDIRSSLRTLVSAKQKSPQAGIILLIPGHAQAAFLEETKSVKNVIKLEQYDGPSPHLLLSPVSNEPLEVNHTIHIYWWKHYGCPKSQKGQTGGRTRCGRCPNCLHPKWKKACTSGSKNSGKDHPH